MLSCTISKLPPCIQMPVALGTPSVPERRAIEARGRRIVRTGQSSESRPRGRVVRDGGFRSEFSCWGGSSSPSLAFFLFLVFLHLFVPLVSTCVRLSFSLSLSLPFFLSIHLSLSVSLAFSAWYRTLSLSLASFLFLCRSN